MLKRLRTLVADRPDLSELLVQQARSLHQRVFGPDLSAGEFLEIYIEEARSLFSLIQSRLNPGLCILEIGGGLGIFHVMAYAEGAEIVTVEPSEAGFSVFRKFGLSLIDALTGNHERFVDACVERLNWPENRFDLVVSHNVLEHVADPVQGLREMYRVVRPGGTLLHSCPNYLFPYEPHYKVPVIPCAVRLSGRVCWRAFQADPLWRSLNSINALMVMRTVSSLPGARLVFRKAVGHTLARMETGSHLGRRHGVLTKFVLAPPVRALLMALPPQLLTPMIFEITKEDV